MKLKAILMLVFVLLAVNLILVTSIEAAKPRVRKLKTGASTGVAYSSAKLSRPTNSAVLTLLNLDKTKSVSYILSYTANGIAQGAGGSVTPAGQTTDKRDLYFGTCSKNVCTPHTNIKNASLLVTTSLKSGSTHTKRYRIRV